MRMIEWAFEQDIPHASKLVLVYLAANASAEGVGRMNRKDLMQATGYKTRSIQRLLKDLRNAGYLEIVGPWYLCGDMAPRKLDGESAKLLAKEIGQLPDALAALKAPDVRQFPPPVAAEAIAHIVGDYVVDQLASFEARIGQRLDAFAVFHVEQEIKPPPDPVIENPLYEQLIDSGMERPRAYALSERDLEMGEELDNEAAPVSDEDYPDSIVGRFERIVDILHGADASEMATSSNFDGWERIEEAENKYTVKGEPAAFLLLYPAIVDAARAGVGKYTISDFCDPKRAESGDAPWDKEINPIDKEDPALEVDITRMLGEIEATNAPNCQVMPRTTEKYDDGSVVQETILGFHRRVKAKYNQMLQLKQMEIIG